MEINSNNTIIIGWGMTGKAIGNALGVTSYIDQNHGLESLQLRNAQMFIFCLPTPTIDGKQDISAIEEWLSLIKGLEIDPIIVIRSTILPGTTDKLIRKYSLKIAHVPEFLTEATAIEDARNPELLVVGARDILVRDTVMKVFSPGHLIIKHKITCSPTTAELIKYAMNSFFALKVIYGNQFWDAAKKMGANYEQVQEALENHKWGAKNGWNVWQGGFRGFKGSCLPKDIEALINVFDMPLLEKMMEINKKLIKETE